MIFYLRLCAKMPAANKIGFFYGIRRQHPGPEDQPQDKLASWSPRCGHPAEGRQATKAPSLVNREVRKAATAATRAEVRLAAIQCVVRYENRGRTSADMNEQSECAVCGGVSEPNRKFLFPAK